MNNFSRQALRLPEWVAPRLQGATADQLDLWADRVLQLVPLQDQAYFERFFRRHDLAQRIP